MQSWVRLACLSGVGRSNLLAVNNRFPGPLITANKGDTLKITVNNKLTDPTMRRSTTIVSPHSWLCFALSDALLFSTGTDCFKRARLMKMALLL
jgi:FtsP/CotA-like multicopper oxidase with cupredoxin domain